MRKNEIGYAVNVKRKSIEYSINWSNYFRPTKENILKKLNEMTGIYVLFQLNQYKRLSPLMLGMAWYTGLRTTLLKLFDRVSIDRVPDHILLKVKDEIVFLKYIEVYKLQDASQMLYKLKENYPDIFFDPNGIACPANMDYVKVIDINTKIIYKKKTTDI